MEENIQSLHAGTVLCGGKYIIEKKIGEGGFGITYKAIQNGLNRAVCIKEYFLAGRCARNTRSRTVYVQGTSEALFEKYRQGFVKEAKMLSTLHNPNIVEVIDVFDENNTSYMVMDFIKGKSLQSLVESNGRLPYPEAVNYMAQVAGAVGYIHERNILHRDIKPDNIMITDDYKAILIDFGSAREFEHDKTQVHTSMLTHGYAPTEQYTANSRKGYYTDIYAIGATLYFILTGQVPLEAAARMTEPMPSPKELAPEIPDEANRTILKAMQLKAENRHQCIQDFMDDLRNVKPSVLVDETIGAGSKNKKLWAGLGVAGCVIVLLLGFLIFRPKNSGKENKYETVDFTGMDMYPMIKVVGGTFKMGNGGTNEADCAAHRVKVSDFYIGQYEVSQKLWEYIMGNNPSEYRDSEKELPVENVSFSAVQDFIRELNSRTGQKFSLPTEAQWEYAARGGAKGQDSLYAGGDHLDRLWYQRDHARDIKEASVNKLGIYQMSGNVAEWCLDYYDQDFYEESADPDNPIDNPINKKESENRVVRGGSFADDDIENLRVYHRGKSKAAKPYIGFRLVINE